MLQDVPVLPAATILILRESPGLEVLMLHRHPATDFVPGAMLFPGGKVDDGDADPAWVTHCEGWQRHAPSDRMLRIAAVREIFEETGLVLTRDRLPPDFAGGAALMALRAAVERGAMLFRDVIAGAGLKIDLDGLSPLSRWVTPPVVSRRFDTHFYLASLPAGQEPVVDGREAVDLEWLTPEQGLTFAAAGTRNILLPTRLNIESLRAARTVAEARQIAARQPHLTVEPEVIRTEGRITLVIDPRHGYGLVTEDLPAPPR